MNHQVSRFFASLRQVFGICPECGDLFRLSDCAGFGRTKPETDWMDSLLSAENSVSTQEDQLSEAEYRIRSQARERGRNEAREAVRKLDQVFAPRKMDPEDVVGIFHPVDYLIFNNRSAGEIKSLTFLDRENRRTEELPLQRSIKEAIRMGRYDWKTLRISCEGEVEQE